MVNALGGMAVILKPPQNFETIYQGQAKTTPIAFVAADDNGEFLPLDVLAGKPGVSPTLERFVPVTIGSSLLILIPVPRYQDGASLRSPTYLYDLRWRLRSVSDYAAREQEGHQDMPFSVIPTFGAPSAPSPTPRRVIPAYATEQVTPALVGSSMRPLLNSSTSLVVSQGIYDPANFAGAGSPTDGDEAVGITFYPPYLRPIVGNEFSICATQATGNWDFSDTGATGDAAFSNLYGTNIAGPSHASYPGVGIILVVLSRNTTP